MLSEGRLVLVDTGGLLGEVIAGELGDRSDVHIVSEIDAIAEFADATNEATVCIVFDFFENLDKVRNQIGAHLRADSLIILIDHTDPFISLFGPSDACVHRRRMGLQELVATLRAFLDEGSTHPIRHVQDMFIP